jgi:aminoglycoside 3-N-acetyltransferase
MITQQDIERSLAELGLGKESRVLVHSSYKSLGSVAGGPAAVARAAVKSFGTVMMPAFTWDRTRIWDARGVFDGNAYAEQPQEVANPEPFTFDTPIDTGIGVIPETFRMAYQVRRSANPLVSFVACGELAEQLCGPGTEVDGVEPIRRLMEAGGDVLLLGVDHTSSTAIHLAEQMAGRPLFVRHALTPEGVQALHCGGCGDAFERLQPHVAHIERRSIVGNATLRSYPLRDYVDAARGLIKRDPFALLCDTCDRCRAHRSRVPV